MSMGGEGHGHVDTPENVSAAFETQTLISSPSGLDTNMVERSLRNRRRLSVTSLGGFLERIARIHEMAKWQGRAVGGPAGGRSRPRSPCWKLYSKFSSVNVTEGGA